jgi:N-methylhydantoinase A
VRNREPEVTTENEVANFAMAAPSVAIHSIGAGGGSIAWIDRAGRFCVGPQSAGAEPGPICYGMGGEEPTVTDADLVLGYLNPAYFLGGKMRIGLEPAKKGIKEKISDKLGMTLDEGAFGIYKIINTNMAEGIRVPSVFKGYDPRACLMVCAGGAGPVHACDIAKELGMPLILVPKASSVYCAAGMLISDIRHDFARVTHMVLLPEHIDLDLINSRFRDMLKEGNDALEREGIPPEKRQFSYAADMRYEAQFNEITVPVPVTNGRLRVDEIPKLNESFDAKHEVLFAYNLPEHPQELMTLRLSAVGVTEKPVFAETSFVGEDASGAIKARREIYYEGKRFEVPIYDGPRMGNGNKLNGPAIVEEPTTTIFVTHDWQLTCDRYSNYLMFRKGMSLEESFIKVGVKK